MLAEEIQHGLDRATGEAGRFARRNRNLSPDDLVGQFHIEVFQRVLENAKKGVFGFLTPEDLDGIRGIVKLLGG